MYYTVCPDHSVLVSGNFVMYIIGIGYGQWSTVCKVYITDSSEHCTVRKVYSTDICIKSVKLSVHTDVYSL